MQGLQRIRSVARAWEGDAVALRELVEIDADGTIAAAHRAGPALHRAATMAGADGPAREAWHRQAVASAGRQMLLESTLDALADMLRDAGVPWVPIKGLDLCRRPGVYPAPELRVTSDVDMLIPEDRLDDARRAVVGHGWTDLVHGPRAENYLRDEGYAWSCRDPNGALVEVHFRLWAQAPSDMAPALLANAEPGADGVLRLRPEDAYLLAAVHAFTVPPPRGAGIWRDLSALGAAASDADAMAESVVRRALSFDLQLPVLLASRVAAELWDDATARRVEEALLPDLRPAERRLADAHPGVDATSVSLARLAWARLRSRRRARHGLVRAVWRRLWPHPGVVEAATDPERPWPLRRWEYHAALRRRRAG